MRARHLLSLLVGATLPVLAAADVGQPSSFSVTISRSSGAVGAVLQVTTQGAVNPAPSDSVNLVFQVFPAGASPISDSATVLRGLPTSNTQFASSFSLSVPNEQVGFKYLATAVAGSPSEYGIGYSSPYAEVISFALSLQPSIDLLLPPTPPGATPTPGGPWFWAKGKQEAGRAVPALSLLGLVGLGVLLSLLGAALVRRS
jgi:hypothetical protein